VSKSDRGTRAPSQSALAAVSSSGTQCHAHTPESALGTRRNIGCDRDGRLLFRQEAGGNHASCTMPSCHLISSDPRTRESIGCGRDGLVWLSFVVSDRTACCTLHERTARRRACSCSTTANRVTRTTRKLCRGWSPFCSGKRVVKLATRR